MNMRVRRGFAPLVALCILALSAAPATAAPDNVPSDNSGAVQYTEALPGAEGNQTSKALRKAREKAVADGTLSRKEARRLEALGKEGADAARLAAAAATGKAANGGAANGNASSDPSDSSGSSGAQQVAGAVTGSSDSGGTGLLLPLLGLAALVAIGVLIWRWRVARGY
jgi:cobalamin biosynthesis Mg chelatase CobN